MTLPYIARLVCLSFASFFLIHLLFGFLVTATSAPLMRATQRMDPRVAVRVALSLRFLPAAFALVAVAGVCVPSYLLFEPRNIAEPMGWACLLGAALCVLICAASFARVSVAVVQSFRYTHSCSKTACRMQLAGENTSLFIFEDRAPTVLLCGILRPRVLVSSTASNALSSEELAVAFRHEHAHCLSRDNWKRLLLLLAPGILPFWHGFRTLERAWARFAEWAADDRAAAGDPARSASLASALVHLARLSNRNTTPALATSLLAPDCDLAERVERLLKTSVTHNNPPRATSLVPSAFALCLLAIIASLFVHNTGLSSVHTLLERLIH
ncbi:MAG: hypothetical protein JO211_01110 [Acidobacteriaceae bacterium]|nr:hypothetical protein [Acidobacteriaceae bacterium]